MAKSETLGIAELSAAMRELGQEVETRTARGVAGAGGAVLRKRARANAQALGLRRSGALLKNIVIKRETQAPPGTAQYNLGVRHGRSLTRKQKSNNRLAVNKEGRIVKRYEDDPYYWRFLEFDTAKRKGTPYIGPALEDGKDEVLDAMATRAWREIEKKAQRK